MNVIDTLRGFVRRWYIVIPVLLAAVAAGFAAAALVPPTHALSATQVMLPAETDIPEDANPFLYVGGLAPAADVVIRAAMAEDVVRRFTEGLDGVEVSMARDSSTGAPVIVTTVAARNDADAAAVLDAYIDNTARLLNDIQADAGVAPDGRITIRTLTVDDMSRIEVKDRFTAVGVATAAVLIAGLLGAALTDGILMSRSRRPGRTGANADADADADADPADAEDGDGEERRDDDLPAEDGRDDSWTGDPLVDEPAVAAADADPRDADAPDADARHSGAPADAGSPTDEHPPPDILDDEPVPARATATSLPDAESLVDEPAAAARGRASRPRRPSRAVPSRRG
ncbi:hypothetical protein [Microbacterium allomyrinae]|uniref:Polysaccharide chain length determinant N-terminal domain-containing protein n=1 Tax=Microbacterium allomyrinae TaxID=2830666 RepID=A0A9X1LVT6_9MICO|nr:hypothetical protein [Microbacterium allomyrinae]MCC2033022.1 hypothetical protein [Microbacterium allomyrinae]